MQRVAVVGAGVSGLTCGVVLQEGGYAVTVFESPTHKAASPVAAAIWYPYHIGAEGLGLPACECRLPATAPTHSHHHTQVPEQWALDSYREFEQLARDPRTGVSMVEFQVTGHDRRSFLDFHPGIQLLIDDRRSAADGLPRALPPLRAPSTPSSTSLETMHDGPARVPARALIDTPLLTCRGSVGNCTSSPPYTYMRPITPPPPCRSHHDDTNFLANYARPIFSIRIACATNRREIAPESI